MSEKNCGQIRIHLLWGREEHFQRREAKLAFIFWRERYSERFLHPQSEMGRHSHHCHRRSGRECRHRGGLGGEGGGEEECLAGAGGRHRLQETLHVKAPAPEGGTCLSDHRGGGRGSRLRLPKRLLGRKRLVPSPPPTEFTIEKRGGWGERGSQSWARKIPPLKSPKKIM